MKFQVQCRGVAIVNTDPQRRCYNGVNFSEKKIRGEWEPFLKEPCATKERAEYIARLFKRETLEFRVVEVNDETS